MSAPTLSTPLVLRGVTLPNRLVVAPMCQYSVVEGVVGDHHLVHLGRFALGGFGTVVVEATAVTRDGRISHGDVGLWDDGQVAGLARIAAFLREHGAVPAVQLAHAGGKASSHRPWDGEGPVTAASALPGEEPWQTVGPSEVPLGEGWPTPHALTTDELAELARAWVAATHRAERAGFDVLEVHAAHGYLLNEFLSPLTNTRTDAYGGSLEARMRFPLEVVAAVRAAWPADKPLLVRVSAVDGAAVGTTIEDTVAFARELAALGVDAVDVSGGGVGGGWQHPIGYGYQVPFAAAVKEGSGLPTMAVGIITEPAQAEAVLTTGQADLVALARAAQDDPNWPLHAARELSDGSYDAWPVQSGPRLAARDRLLGSIGPWTGPDPVQLAPPRT